MRRPHILFFIALTAYFVSQLLLRLTLSEGLERDEGEQLVLATNVAKTWSGLKHGFESRFTG